MHTHHPTTLKCPNCASALREQDFNQEKGMVSCGYCGAIMLPPTAMKAPAAFIPRPLLPLPSSVSVQRSADGILITRKWFQWHFLLLIPFSLFFGRLALEALTMMGRRGTPNFVSLFFMLASFSLCYYVLAHLINRTKIHITLEELTVSHGPLPWLGYRHFPSGALDQFYCKEVLYNSKNGPTPHFQLWCRIYDGTHHKLMDGGLNPAECLYIEQQIESVLKINDRTMPGEVRRS